MSLNPKPLNRVLGLRFAVTATAQKTREPVGDPLPCICVLKGC